MRGGRGDAQRFRICGDSRKPPRERKRDKRGNGEMAQNMDLRFQNRSAASARAPDADEPQDGSRSLRALLVLDYLAPMQLQVEVSL